MATVGVTMTGYGAVSRRLCLPVISESCGVACSLAMLPAGGQEDASCLELAQVQTYLKVVVLLLMVVITWMTRAA